MTYGSDYDVTVPLPYPVFDLKGQAKYDKSLKVLTLTLPGVPKEVSAETTVKLEEAVEEMISEVSEKVTYINSWTLNPT